MFQNVAAKKAKMYINFEDKLVVMGTYLPECLWSLRGAPRFINDKLFMKIEAGMNLNSAKNFETYVICGPK